MPYFPVDDGFHSHRKAIKAGAHAVGLWTLCGSWSNDNGTDGFIPDYVAARFDPAYESLAARLVEVGLWAAEEIGGEKGWIFHDWTGEEGGEKRNYTRAEVEKKRRDWANRQAKSRERRAGLTPGVTPPVTRDNNVTHAGVTGESRVAAPDVRNPPENVTRDSRVSPRVPVPVPVPVPEVQSQVPTAGVDLVALPPAKNSDETPEEDKPAAMRSPLTVVRCPDHMQPKIGNCVFCKQEHGNARWFVNPDNWPEIRRQRNAQDFALVVAWSRR